MKSIDIFKEIAALSVTICEKLYIKVSAMMFEIIIMNYNHAQTKLHFVLTCSLQLSVDSFLLPRNRGIEFSREMKRGWEGEEKGG